MVCTITHVTPAAPNWTITFLEVFGQKYFNILPPHRPSVDLDVKLEDRAKPYHSQLYLMLRAYHVELWKWINENLATGCIYQGDSPWASPLFFKKENDKLWPVIDYKELNRVMKKKAYPLPLIWTILDQLQRFQYYTKLDVWRGFNNIQTSKHSEALLAFICEDGHFLCQVMPFRVSNTPTIFQSFMDAIF